MLAVAGLVVISGCSAIGVGGLYHAQPSKDDLAAFIKPFVQP
jgi:hypothetical protein